MVLLLVSRAPGGRLKFLTREKPVEVHPRRVGARCRRPGRGLNASVRDRAAPRLFFKIKGKVVKGRRGAWR